MSRKSLKDMGMTASSHVIIYKIPDVAFTCSKCKVNYPNESDLMRTYTWTNNDQHRRYICKTCHCKAMDKLYELDRNIDAEITLFGEGE